MNFRIVLFTVSYVPIQKQCIIPLSTSFFAFVVFLPPLFQTPPPFWVIISNVLFSHYTLLQERRPTYLFTYISLLNIAGTHHFGSLLVFLRLKFMFSTNSLTTSPFSIAMLL